MSTDKPARRIAEIPPETLARLNDGSMAARNLVEGLAVDFRKLLRAVAPALPSTAFDAFEPGLGITRRMEVAAKILTAHGDTELMDQLMTSRSDTVRGWAAYAIAQAPRLSLKQRLSRIRALADDEHFGVREWAWLAMRPHVAGDIEAAIALLTPWTANRSTGIRRFASEITRPRGVWCAHIDRLRQSPELGLPILEPLRSDPEKYVQHSVANWLNDAARSQPAWVKKLCARWQRESKSAATARIIKRGMRSL